MLQIAPHRPWTPQHFRANKYLWQHRGYAACEQIRLANLRDVSGILRHLSLTHWLHGGTLGAVVQGSGLPEDHDDDLGVWQSDLSRVLPQFQREIQQHGFQVIRANARLVSLERQGRYLDLCLFRRRWGLAGYGSRYYPASLLADFRDAELAGISLPVPTATAALLRIHAASRLHNSLRFCMSQCRRRVPERAARKLALRSLQASPARLRALLSLATRPLGGVRYRALSEAEFRACRIEPVDSFNWSWRQPHLDLLTDNQRLVRIDEIINHLRERLGTVRLQIRETDTRSSFKLPLEYNRDFWQTGNNYLIYNVIYQFRKHVVPYKLANAYIAAGGLPMLYSAEYYDRLPIMSDAEIGVLAADQPLQICDGALTSGKHRACAMIGRLVSGKPYIPFTALIAE